MYAIVEIAGQQFKVEEGKKIFVHRLEAEEGANLEFDKVLLIEDNGKITIGEPVISDFVVDGVVLDHMRGDKVIVFKKKRKKGYRIKNGHRQNFSQVEIVSIGPKGAPKKAVKKAEPKIKEARVTEESVKVKKAPAKKTAAKKEEAPAKKSTEKKPAEKKPASKKPSTKKPAKGKK
ncbi:MAG: 50S ribosomal protein L21 [Bacteroidetes bacterium GWE2_41_25]|nr:MAG: 50S ribosomal protein L21 [Bacteroidetes bacterium GWA2_40_15]OFX90074.1 MAG: 50S ribosomal protein L21 [Bacteroidetes bacterium GWC2_40_22]OFX95066.1 MAG: 50S ribosomal protein L21 [Bacteroidetes bacterium GWE2_41_25]OFY58062.1 MAG: 50S ribosomal protein L21 [Bacteroidetes bacterium GWF2_41_9]HAM09834.1 50S ribosomal protein L21 [Bacteroidales bacterium]